MEAPINKPNILYIVHTAMQDLQTLLHLHKYTTMKTFEYYTHKIQTSFTHGPYVKIPYIFC